MPDAWLYTTQRIEFPAGAGVLPLLVPGVVVGGFIDRRWVVDWVAVTRLRDIYNMKIVQRRCGGGVLTLACRGYRSPSLKGIPLTRRYGNALLSRRNLRIPRSHTLLFIVDD
jgi:hypothetical protein